MSQDPYTTWQRVGLDAPGAWIITHTDMAGRETQIWLTKEDAAALALDILDQK